MSSPQKAVLPTYTWMMHSLSEAHEEESRGRKELPSTGKKDMIHSGWHCGLEVDLRCRILTRTDMENFYARSVFFVKDGEESLAFYTQTLGFGLDWNKQYEGRAWVFQVSLFGFELILNQAYSPTQNRAGHGRVFIGLDDDQAQPLLRHIRERGINA